MKNEREEYHTQTVSDSSDLGHIKTVDTREEGKGPTPGRSEVERRGPLKSIDGPEPERSSGRGTVDTPDGGRVDIFSTLVSPSVLRWSLSVDTPLWSALVPVGPDSTSPRSLVLSWSTGRILVSLAPLVPVSDHHVG